MSENVIRHFLVARPGMRVLKLLPLLCLSLSCALAFGADTEVNPVRKPPTTETAAPGVLRLIVKFRPGVAAAAATKTGATQAPPTSPSPSASQAAAAGKARASAAAKRAGLVLAEAHEIAAGMHAMKVQPLSSGDTLAATLARLRADPTIEYAEPDYQRYVHAAPNDPIFQSSQWHLKNDPTTPSAIDAVDAWDVTQGADSVVVAIADTGVRFDHPDLKRVSEGGRLLDGYDFIIDTSAANDGNGRDADASDPGDWCGSSSSSWHGTRTAGIVGALTSNATGVAGITWHGRILPVRGLGKCGGADSDLIAGVLWAAGIHVAGVPDNTTPAKIINMSFGSSGACPASWQDAVSQVVARGVLMVISAGNEGGVVDSPANCAGVAAVAAIRHAGTKVGFSNLGPKIAISAPGGNCVNTNGGPCLYSIDTTSNAGATTPGGNNYTDQQDFNVGTSFSAPIVAGIAALMVSVNSRLDSVQLIRRLQNGARPFPKSSDTTIPDCHVPAGGGDLQTSECNCTTDTCGAGMANARGAVAEALRPAAVASASPTAASSGQTVSLDGSGSFASNGRAIASYAWTVAASTGPAPTIANANTANASFNATDAGPVQLRLTVTDDQGAQDSAVVNVNGAVPAITVAVSPGTVSVHAGGGTQSFTASVANTSNTAVTWQVNGVTGGNATVGTVSTAGLYTAPASVPSPATVTVTAVSVADDTRSGSAQVTVTAATTSGGGGGGGGGGAIDPAWLMAVLLLLLRPRGQCAIRPQRSLG